MKTQNLHLSRINFFGLTTILLILAVLAMGARAQAFTWHTANQFTVAWDAVTVKDDGKPLPATDSIEYTLYVVDAIADPTKANPTEVWRGSDLQALITISVEGQYWAGVRSHRMLADGSEASQSVIVWSDDPAAVSGDTWGMRYFIPPGKAMGLKKQ